MNRKPPVKGDKVLAMQAKKMEEMDGIQSESEEIMRKLIEVRLAKRALVDKMQASGIAKDAPSKEELEYLARRKAGAPPPQVADFEFQIPTMHSQAASPTLLVPPPEPESDDDEDDDESDEGDESDEEEEEKSAPPVRKGGGFFPQ